MKGVKLMFVKVINKNDKVYYLLCVCDSKTKVWVEHFIKEEIALLMINVCNLKVKER